MNEDIDLPLYVKCDGYCNGHGCYFLDGVKFPKCAKCNGTGRVYLPELELEK